MFGFLKKKLKDAVEKFSKDVDEESEEIVEQVEEEVEDTPDEIKEESQPEEKPEEKEEDSEPKSDEPIEEEQEPEEEKEEITEVKEEEPVEEESESDERDESKPIEEEPESIEEESIDEEPEKEEKKGFFSRLKDKFSRPKAEEEIEEEVKEEIETIEDDLEKKSEAIEEELASEIKEAIEDKEEVFEKEAEEEIKEVAEEKEKEILGDIDIEEPEDETVETRELEPEAVEEPEEKPEPEEEKEEESEPEEKDEEPQPEKVEEVVDKTEESEVVEEEPETEVKEEAEEVLDEEPTVEEQDSESEEPKTVEEESQPEVKNEEIAEVKEEEPESEKEKEVSEIVEEETEEKTEEEAEPEESESEEKEEFQQLEDEPEPEEEKPKKEGFFGKLRKQVVDVVTKTSISENKFNDMFWDIEMVMLENNVAVEVIEKVKNDLKTELVDKSIRRGNTLELIMETLKNSINDLFEVSQIDLIENIKGSDEPYVVAFVGINGSGKTTTIGKIAHLLKKNNLSCVMAAADTFRAAAIQQLEEHANNLEIKMIKHDYGADPAAVAFDAIKYAKSKNIDCVLIDTAGRLHSNTNLVDEMKKIVRVAKPNLKIFVGESITGNDCVEQAQKFNEAVELDGIILSKADVDDKGGAAISVSYVTGKPILFIGTGQGYDDLQAFDKDVVISSLGL